MKNKVLKELILFIIGGLVYVTLEIIGRGFSSWTMAIVGGICFLFIGQLNERYTYEMSIISQMFISAIFVTALEFISGCIINLWLHMGVWDYSNEPYNLCGQICLLFSNLWFVLSLIGIFLDDFIRWKLFAEEKPHYKIL